MIYLKFSNLHAVIQTGQLDNKILASCSSIYGVYHVKRELQQGISACNGEFSLLSKFESPVVIFWQSFHIENLSGFSYGNSAKVVREPFEIHEKIIEIISKPCQILIGKSWRNSKKVLSNFWIRKSTFLKFSHSFHNAPLSSDTFPVATEIAEFCSVLISAHWKKIGS